MQLNDFDLDEALTCEVVAETVGARRSLVIRLARQGLLETLESTADEPLLPRRAVVQLRRMQRLRRDLGPEGQQFLDRAGGTQEELPEHPVVHGDGVPPGDQRGPPGPVQVEQVGRVQ